MDIKKAKAEYLKQIDFLIKQNLENYDENNLPLWAQYYFEVILKDNEPKQLSEKAYALLSYMKNNKDAYNNVFTSKSIAEGMGISGRSVSGSMRGLVDRELVEKIGENPSSYALK